MNNEIEADEETQKQYEIEDSYDDLDKKTKKKVKGIEGRNDLWINHLHKSKAENSINEQKIKPVGKEEEWEDCEDYDENYEDLEEIEEEDYEEEKKIEKKTEVKSKINGLSELSETILAREDPLNILKTFEVNKNVKMKYYDENGLLVDGYDYYQHIAKKDTEGTVTMVYNAEYEYPPQLKPDIDYQPEEMNAERKKNL